MVRALVLQLNNECKQYNKTSCMSSYLLILTKNNINTWQYTDDTQVQNIDNWIDLMLVVVKQARGKDAILRPVSWKSK